MDSRIRRCSARVPARLARFSASRSLLGCVLALGLVALPGGASRADPNSPVAPAIPPRAQQLTRVVQQAPVTVTSDQALPCPAQWLAYHLCMLGGGAANCAPPQCMLAEGSTEAALAQALLQARLARDGANG